MYFLSVKNACVKPAISHLDIRYGLEPFINGTLDSGQTITTFTWDFFNEAVREGEVFTEFMAAADTIRGCQEEVLPIVAQNDVEELTCRCLDDTLALHLLLLLIWEVRSSTGRW